MALALNNTQGELHPLEVGLHALRSGLTGREYAKRLGISEQTLSHRIKAARVTEAVTNIGNKVADRWLCLAEIHAAPQWAWSALVEALLDENWTVEATRKQVGRFAQYPFFIPAHTANGSPSRPRWRP